MSTVPFPALPNPIEPFIPSSVGVGIDINLIGVTQDALTASIGRLAKDPQAAKFLEGQIFPLFEKINNGIETYIKSRNLSAEQAADFRKNLSKAIVAQVSASSIANGFDPSFDKILTNFDGKITLKFDRGILNTLPAPSVEGFLALLSNNVFGNTDKTDNVVEILRNNVSYQGFLGVGDIRFSFSVKELSNGNFTPQIGFNIKLSNDSLTTKSGDKKKYALASEFIITANANGSATFELSGKLESKFQSSIPGAPDIGKATIGAGKKITVSLGDVFYINDYVGASGTVGAYAIKIKGTDNQDYYFTVPASALVVFGFSSYELGNIRNGIRSSNGAQITIIGGKDKNIHGFASFLPDSASIAGYTGALDSAQNGIKGVSFILQILAARKAVSVAGPVGALIAFAPEIYDGTNVIFRYVRDAINANVYTNSVVVSNDARIAYNELIAVLKNNGILVDQLDRDVLHDIATGLFIKEAAAKYRPEVAARLISALVFSGQISVDHYFNAFNAAAGRDDILPSYFGDLSVGDGTIGGAVAVLKNDPFARALNGLHRFQLGVDKAFDIKLLFGQRNEGEQQFLLDGLYKSGVDPFSVALGVGVLENASQFRRQYAKDFNQLYSPSGDYTLEYDFIPGVNRDLTARFFEAYRFSRAIYLGLTVDIKYQYEGENRVIIERKTPAKLDGRSVTNYYTHKELNANALWYAGINGLDDLPKLLDFIKSKTDPEEYSLRLRALERNPIRLHRSRRP